MPNRSSGDKTKLVLANSLRDLMKKKPLDKIKIREIVENCGLNRQTFYYHFQDLYALVEWMYMFDGKEIVDANYEDGDVMATGYALLQYVENHREELATVTDSKAEIYFFNFLRTGVGQCFEIIIDKISKGMKISKEYKIFLSNFCTNAIVGVIDEWIKTPESSRLTTDEMLEMFNYTFDGTMKLALKNYCESEK